MKDEEERPLSGYLFLVDSERKFRIENVRILDHAISFSIRSVM